MGTCYKDSPTKKFPLERMFEMLDNVSKAGAPSDGSPWAMQALWQETDASNAIGERFGSSVLNDENRSELNFQVTTAVKSGRFPSINLLEVDNVCHGGPDLLKALRDHALGQAAVDAAVVVV